jgi:hypothetical protein
MVWRLTSASVTATVTPNADTTDLFELFPATGTYVFQLPSGTPTAGQQMRISIVSTGAANKTVTWAATGYRPTAAAQLITNIGTGLSYIYEFVYVTSNSLNKWVLFNQPTGMLR